MALPWLRILDGVLGLTDVARTMRRRPVAALGEPDDRIAATDHERLQFEREQRNAERKRDERLLKLELARQAGERDIARLRLVAGIAVVSVLGTIVLSARIGDLGTSPRIALGAGWFLLLAGLAAAFTAQAQVASALGRLEEAPAPSVEGVAGAAAPWLVVAGLGVTAMTVLLR